MLRGLHPTPQGLHAQRCIPTRLCLLLSLDTRALCCRQAFLIDTLYTNMTDAAPAFAKGDPIWYRHRSGAWLAGSITYVDKSLIPPAYQVETEEDGVIRDTEGPRLLARPARSAAPATGATPPAAGSATSAPSPPAAPATTAAASGAPDRGHSHSQPSAAAQQQVASGTAQPDVRDMFAGMRLSTSSRESRDRSREGSQKQLAQHASGAPAHYAAQQACEHYSAQQPQQAGHGHARYSEHTPAPRAHAWGHGAEAGHGNAHPAVTQHGAQNSPYAGVQPQPAWKAGQHASVHHAHAPWPACPAGQGPAQPPAADWWHRPQQQQQQQHQHHHYHHRHHHAHHPYQQQYLPPQQPHFQQALQPALPSWQTQPSHHQSQQHTAAPVPHWHGAGSHAQTHARAGAAEPPAHGYWGTAGPGEGARQALPADLFAGMHIGGGR
jgi:hypothetical protein